MACDEADLTCRLTSFLEARLQRAVSAVTAHLDSSLEKRVREAHDGIADRIEDMVASHVDHACARRVHEEVAALSPQIQALAAAVSRLEVDAAAQVEPALRALALEAREAAARASASAEAAAAAASVQPLDLQDFEMLARRTAEAAVASARDAAARALAAHREEASAELRGLGGGVRLALDRIEAELADLRRSRDTASPGHALGGSSCGAAADTPAPSAISVLGGSPSAPRQQRLVWAASMGPGAQAGSPCSRATPTPSGSVVPQSAIIVTGEPRGGNPQLNLSPRHLGFSDACSPPSSHAFSLATGSPRSAASQQNCAGGLGGPWEALQGGVDQRDRFSLPVGISEASPAPPRAVGVSPADRGATAVTSLAEWLADSSFAVRGGVPGRDLIRAAARELVSLANRDTPSEYSHTPKEVAVRSQLQAQGRVEGGTGGPSSCLDGA